LVPLFIDDAHLAGDNLFVYPNARVYRLGDNQNLLLTVGPTYPAGTRHGARTGTKKTRQKAPAFCREIAYTIAILDPAPRPARGRGKVEAGASLALLRGRVYRTNEGKSNQTV
jgi:hypothetical protein